MNLRISWYGCNISLSPQHILVPRKVFDIDTDIYFDIYQLCADKHAVASIFCISVPQIFVTVRSHEDTI